MGSPAVYTYQISTPVWINPPNLGFLGLDEVETIDVILLGPLFGDTRLAPCGSLQFVLFDQGHWLVLEEGSTGWY